MSARRLLLLFLLVSPFLAGAEGGSCTRLDDPSEEEEPNPANPAQPFLDAFNGGLVLWRLTVPVPNYELTAGNPFPSMEVGSQTTLATGGLTVRKFDASGGLLVEADVFRQAPTANTTAAPQFWVGLSDEDDPTGTPGVAAGVRMDAAGTLHFQVNGADIGTTQAPSAGAWHRFTTTIRVDRVVEFRIDGQLVLTGGVLDSTYLVRAIEACGIGFPERPQFDNVGGRLP
jgi:hypothetical protein